MKVKIGDKIYDPSQEPIMLIFNDRDKENLKNMPEDAYVYICFPPDTSLDVIDELRKDYKPL